MASKILITGNQGYIGSILCKRLSKNNQVYGLDTGYFSKDVLETNFKDSVVFQFDSDLRNIDQNILSEFDTIISLAALSNDPIGEFNQDITYKINMKATIDLFQNSVNNNVKNFIFISTQSLYGFSDTNRYLSEGNDNINPITAYAKSKWEVEKEIFKKEYNIKVCSLRPSTIFGYSPRFRKDIVLNNLVSNVYLNNSLEILSDGTPWRPVLHIKDLCDCIEACLNNMEKVNGHSLNLGLKNGNYQVKDIAKKVSSAFDSIKPNYTHSHLDPRSYKVSFSKYEDLLGDYFLPFRSIEYGIHEMIDNFNRIDFKNNKNHNCVRLNYLKKLIENKKLTMDLFKI